MAADGWELRLLLRKGLMEASLVKRRKPRARLLHVLLNRSVPVHHRELPHSVNLWGSQPPAPLSPASTHREGSI